jgi:hypothetical protein
MKRKTDPLIAALIAKIPPSEAEWPVDGQLAWLRMAAMAFGAVWGGDAVSVFAGKPTPSFGPVTVPKRSPSLGHPFLIDEKGLVKNAKSGKRVNANEIDGTIFDMRGQEGDMRTITWADNSTGINGKDLTITA